MTAFEQWWTNNKDGVCFDIVKELKLDLADPMVEARLMHVAGQGWVQGGMAAEDEAETDYQKLQRTFTDLGMQFTIDGTKYETGVKRWTAEGWVRDRVMVHHMISLGVGVDCLQTEFYFDEAGKFLDHAVLE